VRDIGPDLRPNDYAKDNEANGEAKTTSSAQEKEPSVVEDLGQFYSLSLSNWGIYGLVFNLLFKWNGCGCNHIVWYTADLCIYCFRSIGFGKLRGLFFFVDLESGIHILWEMSTCQYVFLSLELCDCLLGELNL
jgi:hypothetical protein